MKGMHLIFVLLFAAGFPAVSFSQEKHLVGHFYVVVDDLVTLELEGKEFHNAKIGLSKSGEVTIKEDDVINIRLLNKKGPKRFVLVFLTTDRKYIINFTHKDFRLVPSYDEDGVTAKEFDKLEETAVKLNRQNFAKHVGLKDKSESVWGNANKCRVAVKIRPLMWESYWD